MIMAMMVITTTMMAMIMMTIIYDHYDEKDTDLYDNNDDNVDDDYDNVKNWKKMILIYYNQNSDSFESVAQNNTGKGSYHISRDSARDLLSTDPLQ